MKLCYVDVTGKCPIRTTGSLDNLIDSDNWNLDAKPACEDDEEDESEYD